MTTRLALIDDEELVRESVAQLLMIRGYGVEAYESAEAFLESNSLAVQCVIVDYRLPGQSGFDLVRHLRASGDSTPAILLSGNIDDSLEQVLSSLPDVWTLGKPCLSSQLYETIEKCLDVNG